MMKAAHSGWRKNLRKRMNVEAAAATKTTTKQLTSTKRKHTGATATKEGDDKVEQPWLRQEIDRV